MDTWCKLDILIGNILEPIQKYETVLGSTPVLISTSLSWSWAVYKVYGTFIFVPSLDLSTSDLKPNTDTMSYFSKSVEVFLIGTKIAPATYAETF